VLTVHDVGKQVVQEGGVTAADRVPEWNEHLLDRYLAGQGPTAQR
jgi:hypothetical protein